MAVVRDNWEINPDEAVWFARQRYNDWSPFTVLQYSSKGRPLAIGGEAAARSADRLKNAGITCRVCVAGHKTKWKAGQKPPQVTGVEDLDDFVWNHWCDHDGFEQIKTFVRNVAVKLRTRGVLVYCKQGANRSAAAAIAVIAYITGAKWEQCEETARCARAIVDISRAAPKFPTVVKNFPRRELVDAAVLPQLTKRSIGNAAVSEAQLNKRSATDVRSESSAKRSRNTGIWIFYNQADDMDWPTNRDGPFRADWNTSYDLVQCRYGNIHASGGATGGSASGYPFAVVSAHCPEPLNPQETFGYRYWNPQRVYWTPCPRAAYCWRENPFPTSMASNQGSATLLDMPAYVLRGLLQLATYIETEFERHDKEGAFIERARAENRRAGDIRKAWSRRKNLAKQIADALDGSLAKVMVTPQKFFDDCPISLQHSLRFNEYILSPLPLPVPQFRPKSFSGKPDIDIKHVRAVIARQMHAAVWAIVQESPTSPCQAGYVPTLMPSSIFFNDAAALKACSTRTSKLRVVWVCTRAEYNTATMIAQKGKYDRVLERGTLSIVKSESVDGGRIRLCTELPFAGTVIVKLLAPVFADYFVFDSLAQATQLSNSVKQLLGVPSSMPPSGHVLQNAILEECPSASGLSQCQRDVITAVLESPESVHTLWSIAGGGKTRTVACLLDLWRAQTQAADNDDMAWVMVPRQLLRVDIFNTVQEAFQEGER